MNPRHVSPRELASKQIIPTMMEGSDSRSILSRAGVIFNEATWDCGDFCGKPMKFQEVGLPDGWVIMKSAHADWLDWKWYDLIDNEGRVRGRIKYNTGILAHPWQGQCFVRLTTRFNVVFLLRRYSFPRNEAVCHVLDEGQFGADRIIHTTTPIPRYSEEGMEFAPSAEDQATNLAVQWLDEHYPDWRNPGAYWNNSQRNH